MWPPREQIRICPLWPAWMREITVSKADSAEPVTRTLSSAPTSWNQSCAPGA